MFNCQQAVEILLFRTTACLVRSPSYPGNFSLKEINDKKQNDQREMESKGGRMQSGSDMSNDPER